MAWYDELQGPERDAASALIDMFEQYDLGSLAPKIVDYLQQGYGGETIYLMLQETKEWKTRFAANEKRRAAGLSVLSPQEYIATERAYRQALQAAGVPKGFYDSVCDFQNFLIKDVSPTEIAERAMKAREVVDSVDSVQRAALSRIGIGSGDLMAYYLDTKRSLPELQKRVDLAMLNAERKRAGFNYSDSRAADLFSQGVTVEEARKGYQTIATALPTLDRLGDISGDSDFGLGELENEVFGGDADATRRRGRLESQERARFGGASGQGQRTLQRGRQFSS